MTSDSLRSLSGCRCTATFSSSADAVVEWVRGTLLTDYELRMPATMYGDFVARYRERLNMALGDRRPYFYPFKRILMWGRLPD